jgi:hypothetical protein
MMSSLVTYITILSASFKVSFIRLSQADRDLVILTDSKPNMYAHLNTPSFLTETRPFISTVSQNSFLLPKSS